MILLNGLEITVTRFPNNEALIKGLDQLIEANINYQSAPSSIKLKYENDFDLINLMFVKKYLDDCGIESILYIPYFPYSRMDRASDDYVFTLKYVADFINNLNFKAVVLEEPHSNVTSALLNKVIIIESSTIIAQLVMDKVNFDKEKDYIYFPDITAEKRYADNFKGYKYVTGNKNRDFKTGEITSLSLLGTIESENPNIIMIDDLCSKGGTFKFGAELLRKTYNINNIYLCVAHCENNVYSGDLFKGDLITKMYTTDSILTDFSEKEKLEIIGMEDR